MRCLFVLVFAREHQTLDHKEQTYHSSNRDICPPCFVKSQRGDDILDRAQGQNAKERADDIADAAGQHCAADDGGCDGVHFRAACVRRGAGADVQEIHEAADACENAADEVREEFCVLDVDGQHIGAVAVAADRIDASAELRPAEHHEQNCHDHERHNNADLHIGRNIRAELIDGAHAGHIDARFFQRLERRVFHVELRGVYNGRHALGKEHPRKRDDERLDFKIRDQEALHEAERRADAERQQDGCQEFPIVKDTTPNITNSRLNNIP